MRSSHQQWSWPHASAGASASPSSSVGAGPCSAAAPHGRRERLHDLFERLTGERLGLAGRRAEARPPQQPARLGEVIAAPTTAGGGPSEGGGGLGGIAAARAPPAARRRA